MLSREYMCHVLTSHNIYILRDYWYILTLIEFILVYFLSQSLSTTARQKVRNASILPFEIDSKPWKGLYPVFDPLGRYIFIFNNAFVNVLMSRFSYNQPETEKNKLVYENKSLSKTSIIDSSQKRQQLFQRWRIVEFRLQGWPTIFQCWALNVETTF